MGKLVKTGSKYTDDQRTEAAIQYAIKGNLAAITRDTGIPSPTLHGWTKQEWWDVVIEEVRSEKAAEHRAKYSQIVDAAQSQALDTIDKASPKDAMLMACMGTDKIRLADNLPTSIQGKAESMSSLAKQFQELSEQVERDRRVVSEQ